MTAGMNRYTIEGEQATPLMTFQKGSMTAMKRARILIDTDPGVDDALTILLALAAPEIQLEALTSVHGNIGVETTTRNALAVLEFARAGGIPVARGCAAPLIGQVGKSGEAVHGSSGIGRVVLPEPGNRADERHAIDFLIERILAEPGELSLFMIGPLTNLALAIRKEPRICGAVKEVVMMGGAIRQGGNITPAAEFNIHADPYAAQMVFGSGMPLTLIPLDVTYQCLLTSADIGRLEEGAPGVGRFVREATSVYMDFYRKYEGFDGCALHDPLTLATILAPELLHFEALHVEVDISGGISMGKTLADLMKVSKKPANMRVALGVQGREFIALFLERMASLERRLEGEA